MDSRCERSAQIRHSVMSSRERKTPFFYEGGPGPAGWITVKRKWEAGKDKEEEEVEEGKEEEEEGKKKEEWEEEKEK